MPNVNKLNFQRRMSPRMTPLVTACRQPSLHPTTTPIQHPLSQIQPSSSQIPPPPPLPTPTTVSQLSQSIPARSTLEPTPPLGSHEFQPLHSSSTAYASSPLHSPSQLNEEAHTNHEPSDQPLNMTETAPSINRRTLVAIHNKRFDPFEPAYESLTQIVHSHFDGPYIYWTLVPEMTLNGWWTAFKRLYKWDENRFHEEAVRAVFNTLGGAHLRQVFCRSKKKHKPNWIKQEIWDQMLQIWATDEKYLNRSSKNKRNRESATIKGKIPYHGGSVSTTEHKRRLTKELGKEPSIRQTFIKCYSKKDNGSLDPGAKVILDKFDDLTKRATQEAVTNGNYVNESQVWLDTVGGPKKKRVLCMRSESQTILQQVMVPYHMHHEEPISTSHFVDSIREQMTGMESELQKVNMDFANKLIELEEKMNEDLGRKITSLEDKVEGIHTTVENVQIQMEQNASTIKNAIDSVMANQTSFFSQIKELFNNSS